MANPVAPAGGFQQGGWYEGRQYWDGTFSDPGQINKLSNQIGAGQAVSNEVIAQTNPNNVAYIQQQKQSFTPTAPTSTPAATSTPTPQATVTPGGAATASVFSPAPIDLAGTYNSLVSSAGLTEKDAEIATKKQQATEAKAKINDNPFLSEATRVGRVAKIDELANDTISNLQNEVATKRADIQMQLELQTKQFDINSSQAQQNLSQFNSLLSMGALDNASPEEIANITRATGLSSEVIASAINNKKISGYETSTKSFDDGTDEGFIIYTIDPQGNVVSQSRQVTGKSTKANQSLTYSTDPLINSILQKIKDSQGTSANTGDPDSLWDE